MAKLTPVRAIRKKCLDCCCGSSKEVKLCSVKTCALYGYREGHRPKDGEFTTEDSSMEKNAKLRGTFLARKGM